MNTLKNQNSIVVQNAYPEVRILSSFSAEKNIVTRMLEGNEISYFLDKDAPIEDWPHGKMFHEGFDDFAPWLNDGLGTIGANHGSPYAFRVRMLRHWLTEKDIGMTMTDDAGNNFILVAILNLSEFLLHSDVLHDGGRVHFHNKIEGGLHCRGVRLQGVEEIRGTQIFNWNGQYSPHDRYNSVRLLADGRELAVGETVECGKATLLWDMDLIGSDTFVEYIKAHPGHAISPTDAALEPLVHLDVAFEFQPMGAMRITADCKFCRDFPYHTHYGMTQYYGMVGFEKHELFIPGTKPAHLTDAAGNPQAVADYDAIYTHPDKCRTFTWLDESLCVEEGVRPDRYINLLSKGGRRVLGAAIGYSLTDGITAEKSSPYRGQDWYLVPNTRKCYPYAIHAPNGLHAGDAFRIAAYHRYFDPSTHPEATDCYWIQEGDSLMVYADFHKACALEMELPEEWRGQGISLLQVHHCSVREATVPQDGRIHLTCEANRGGIVLKIGGKP